jgi:AbrB family looped-hinge helix DNA binding protein
MKIFSKGQITIPLHIRSEFRLRPGTDVELLAEAGKVVLHAKRRRRDSIEDWLQKATGVASGRTTTAKIIKLTRREK